MSVFHFVIVESLFSCRAYHRALVLLQDRGRSRCRHTGYYTYLILYVRRNLSAKGERISERALLHSYYAFLFYIELK